MALPLICRSCRYLNRGNVKQLKRTYLSRSYYCEDVWKSRLGTSDLKDVNLNDLYNKIDHENLVTSTMSPVNVDMFVNSVTDGTYTEAMLDLLHRLRRTPATLHTLPSTPHAAIRALLAHGGRGELLGVIDDRNNYGLFPDHYTANIMMDTFLKEGNNRDAAKVAVQLMLQEDFGPPLTQWLALSALDAYIRHPQPQPWEREETVVAAAADDTAEGEEKEEESDDSDEEEDIEWIRVAYVMKPYFDGHFDLREEHALISRSLLMLSSTIQHDVITPNYSSLAHVVSRDYSSLQGGAHVCQQMYDLINSIVPEEAEDSVLPHLKVTDSKSDLSKIISSTASHLASQCEQADIEKQVNVYKHWQTLRREKIVEEQAARDREVRIKKLEEVKEALRKKEELLFFFDHEKEYALQVKNLDEADENKVKKQEIPADYVSKAYWHDKS